jgi:hypothetical protein
MTKLARTFVIGNIVALILSIGSGMIAEAEELGVILTLISGETLNGKLVALDESEVTVDIRGPLPSRTVSTWQAKSIEIIKEGVSYSFPLTKVTADRLQGGLNRETTNHKNRFPVLALMAGAGIGTAAGEEYFAGIGSGSRMGLGLRYYFSGPDPFAGRVFIGVSREFNVLSPDVAVIPVMGSPGQLDAIRFGNTKVNSTNLTLGFASRSTKGGSYLTGSFGVSFMSISLSADGATSSGGYPIAVTETVTVNDSQSSFRLGAGAVIGLTRKFGLSIEGVGDFIMKDAKENKCSGPNGEPIPCFTGPQPKVDVAGSLFGLQLDLIYSL